MATSTEPTAPGPNHLERVTYRPQAEDGRRLRARTLLLQGPVEINILGATALAADEVDKEGCFTGRRYIIETALIESRVVMVIDRLYGWAVPAGTETKKEDLWPSLPIASAVSDVT